MSESECPTCEGARLRKEILSIKVGDKNINELTDMSINQIKSYLNNLELTKTEAMIADMILKEIDKRLRSARLWIRIFNIIKKCRNIIRRRSTKNSFSNSNWFRFNRSIIYIRRTKYRTSSER